MLSTMLLLLVTNFLVVTIIQIKTCTFFFINIQFTIYTGQNLEYLNLRICKPWNIQVNEYASHARQT